jgi:hypothetical protein
MQYSIRGRELVLLCILAAYNGHHVYSHDFSDRGDYHHVHSNNIHHRGYNVSISYLVTINIILRCHIPTS